MMKKWKSTMMGSRARRNVAPEQRTFLRAFSEVTPEKRLTLSSILAELMMRANPGLMKQRARAAPDPTYP
jgi:hypothetical protein